MKWMQSIAGARAALVAASFVAPLFAPPPASAAEVFTKVQRSYTTSPLTTARSVRNQAMGGAGVADPSWSGNGIYNPANFDAADGYRTFFSRYEPYDFYHVHDVGAVATRTWQSNGARGAVGVRHTRESIELPTYRTVFLPEGTNNGYKGASHTTGVTAAGSMPLAGARAALGVAVEYTSLDGFDDDATAWSYDFGLRVDLPVRDFGNGDRLATRAGVSVLNVGNAFEFSSGELDMPRQIRAGLGATLTSGKMVRSPFSQRSNHLSALSLDVDVIPDDVFAADPAILTGVELAVAELIYLRAGAGGEVAEQSDGVSYGAGIAMDASWLRFHVDVATYLSRADTRETLFGFGVEYLP